METNKRLKEVTILQRHVQIGDPHVTTDDADRLSLLANIYEALVAPAGDGSFVPLLARSWSLSEDAKHWQFRLRDNAVFEDGKHLDGSDVVTSLKRIRDGNVGGELGTGGVMAGYLQGSRISSPDALTVDVRLKEPMADLLDLIVDIPILSDAAIAAVQDGQYIGTGRYRVVSARANLVIMELREDIREELAAKERLCPARLSWMAVPPGDERRDHLTKRETTIIAGLTPKEAKRLNESGAGVIARTPTSVCATFMFNLLSGVGQSREVRRAINYAIDVETMVRDIVDGHALLLTGPMTERHLGYDPATRGFDYDPDAARTELAAGGFETPIPITLDVPVELPDEARDLAIFISEYLEAVGFEVTIAVHEDRPAYAEMVKAKEIHDAACFDSSPSSTFRLLREKFHSGLAGPWWLGYNNKKVDELIDAGSREADVDRRRSLYRRAYTLISQDAPWIFLYNPLRLTALSAALGELVTESGWRPSRGGVLKFY